MTNRDETGNDGKPAGEGPESGRRVRGKPGTELAKEQAREEDRSGADHRRASTPPDRSEQTDFSGVEKKLERPTEDD